MTKPISPANLRHIRAGEGDLFNVAGVKFNWKARGENTEFSFSILEQTLLPGEGVSPHSHPYTEFFYILEGQIRFRRILAAEDTGGSDGAEISCTAGDAILVPANMIHTFVNADKGPSRLLGVSTYLHQRFFDAIQEADAAAPFAAMLATEALATIARIGEAHSMIFMPQEN